MSKRKRAIIEFLIISFIAFIVGVFIGGSISEALLLFLMGYVASIRFLPDTFFPYFFEDLLFIPCLSVVLSLILSIAMLIKPKHIAVRLTAFILLNASVIFAGMIWPGLLM